MKTIVTLALILAALPLRALALSLPDPDLTPGSTLTVPVKVLCQPGYSKLVRHTTTATKRRVCEAYHRAFCPGPAWEIDHRIPLCIGGADNELNLWAQPIQESRIKDVVETKLLHWVCSHKISLKNAQSIILGDWESCYKVIKKGEICH